MSGWETWSCLAWNKGDRLDIRKNFFTKRHLSIGTDFRGVGGVTTPGNVQETTGCCTQCQGLVHKVVIGQRLNDFGGLFQPKWFCDFLGPWKQKKLLQSLTFGHSDWPFCFHRVSYQFYTFVSSHFKEALFPAICLTDFPSDPTRKESGKFSHVPLAPGDSY